jgi:biopolymer transport protein TolQ
MTPSSPALWTFIAHASPMVKAVMLILVCISIASWTFIFQKFFLLKQAKNQAKKFEKQFWAEIDQFDKFNPKRKALCGMSRIFKSGMLEFSHLFYQGISKAQALEGAERAMRATQADELEILEKNLPFLATVGSTSPYIGLFGTVWGIMMAFTALGNAQQVTIAMVAPGIAEALIATAIGLFTAIPAVIAYNRYTHEVSSLIHQYETFQEKFSNLLHRKIYTKIHETPA